MAGQIAPAEAQTFYHNAMAVLDNVIVNEQEAKDAVLLAMVSPSEGPTGLALVGGTGGGKTTLSDRSHRLIEDIYHVADLPPQSDLRPVEIVGGKVQSTIVTTDEESGKSTGETKAQTIVGKIDQDTQVIKLNEIDTINPQSLNVIRDVLESGTLTSTEGVTTLRGLLYFISTKNPTDNKGKFEVSDAMASRHAIGVYMGEDDAANEETVEEIFDGFRPVKADKIIPVTDLATITAISDYARSDIAFPKQLKKESAQRLVKASRALIARNIDDTPQRLSVQVMNTALADAALKGQKHLERENIDRAMRFALIARIGLRGIMRSGGTTIPEIVDEIVKG